MFFRISALVAVPLCVIALGATRLSAHEGHDHGAEPAPVAQAASPRLEAASDAFELVAVATGGELTIWLDRRGANEPVTQAAIEVETPEGPRAATLDPEGFYRLPAPWVGRPGHADLIFTVTEGDAVDVLSGSLVQPDPTVSRQITANGDAAPPFGLTAPIAGFAGLALGALAAVALRRRPAALAPALAVLALIAFGALRLLAHEGHSHGPEAASTPALSGDRPQLLRDGSVFVPKPTQRLLALRTAVSGESRHARTVELPGRLIADPNGSGLVQASTTGRLSPPPGGFPPLGATVKAGDILAYVATPFLAIDQSDMRQQQGDLEQQIAIVERRLARYETLARRGAVAEATLTDTRLEMQGLRDRRAALDTARRDAEPLRAPVDGIIAAANAVAGQIADPSAIVFHIVDPKRLWVEALAFEAPQGGRRASARTSDGRGLPLAFVGVGFADRNQAVPVDYRLEGDTDGLRLGQFVTVFAEAAESVAGIAAPRASIVRRANGENVVYEHVTAERFIARPVRVEPLDADRVLIVAGLKPSARLVTQAAELLNQVR